MTFHTNTPPPPFRGALPAAQPIASPTIAPDAPLEATAHHLLDDTDAAIARQTLLQVASLPDRIDTSAPKVDMTAPRWNFEIPFATPQGTAMAQFEISRDGGSEEVEAAKRVWRARFSLDVEPAGPVHALVSLTGEKTSVRMWAERPATAAQLRAGASRTEPGAEPGRTAARRHRDPRRRAAAGRTRRPRRPLSGPRAMSVETKNASLRSRCTMTRPARRGSSPRARASSAPRSSSSPGPTTSRSRRTRCWPAPCPMSRSATKFRPELYKAVAEVLIFVLRLSGRIR